MIGFFRGIRRKMANENKFVQYSRYAIGEIVLVMVGILLALQVNNWNERRIGHNNEIKLIKQLLEDAKADSIFFESRISFQKVRDTLYGDLILYSINRKLDSLGQKPVKVSPFFFRLAYQSNLINNNPNAYDNLSHELIKNKLREYNAAYDYVVHSIDLSNRIIEEYGIPLQMKYQKQLRAYFSKNSIIEDMTFVLNDESVIAVFESFKYFGINYKNQLEAFLIVNQELKALLGIYLLNNE